MIKIYNKIKNLLQTMAVRLMIINKIKETIKNYFLKMLVIIEKDQLAETKKYSKQKNRIKKMM